MSKTKTFDELTGDEVRKLHAVATEAMAKYAASIGMTDMKSYHHNLYKTTQQAVEDEWRIAKRGALQKHLSTLRAELISVEDSLIRDADSAANSEDLDLIESCNGSLTAISNILEFAATGDLL